MKNFPATETPSRMDRVILRDPSPIWGPFREWMSGGPVAVKFHSRSLSRFDLRHYLAMALTLANERSQDEPARLLLVCWQRPRARLTEFGDRLRPGPCEGSWFMAFGDLFEIMIIALNNLPEIPGTSALRIIPVSDDPATIEARIKHLQTDPLIPDAIRKELLADFQERTFPATDAERRLTVDQTGGTGPRAATPDRRRPGQPGKGPRSSARR